MNFEEMMARIEAGLIIIENADGDLPMAAHAYMVAVPGADKDNYSEADITEMQEDLGWSWSDDMGWVFPCLA